MQSRRRTSERQYCELCRSITKDSSTPTRPRPPGRLSYCMSACPSVQPSAAPQTQTLKHCDDWWCSQAKIEAKTQAAVQLYVVHLSIEPSLRHGMTALMNTTYVKEQIRALEADLFLCVVTVVHLFRYLLQVTWEQSGAFHFKWALQWHGLFWNESQVFLWGKTPLSFSSFLLHHLKR